MTSRARRRRRGSACGTWGTSGFQREPIRYLRDRWCGGREVDLRNVTAPVLNIYAEQDHLVPPDASRALQRLVGTRDYTELSFKGGHIGIYVSSRAQREVPSAIHEWLKTRAR